MAIKSQDFFGLKDLGFRPSDKECVFCNNGNRVFSSYVSYHNFCSFCDREFSDLEERVHATKKTIHNRPQD